jgi:FkbM family methyltransferase
MSSSAPTFDLPPPTVYGERILWERPIQIVAEDFLKPGDTVLDIGGNTGGLAIAFSRIVGPQGNVFTFECNPRMIAWMNQDFEANGVGNIEIVNRAAYDRSNVQLKFFLDESFYASASSIYGSGPNSIEVESLSLDDFLNQRRVSPRLIKIDVEGGEADVLEGGRTFIETKHPVLILEFSPGASNFIPQLWQWGYELWDVNTYQKVDEQYFEQRFSTNVVAVPRGHGFYKRDKKGRTINHLRLRPTGEGTARLAIWANGPERSLLTMAQTNLHHLAHHSCAALVLKEANDISVELEQMSGDGSIVWDGLETYRVAFVS